MLQKILLAIGMLAAFACYTNAQTMIEHSSEARFQLDLHVPDNRTISVP